MRSRDLGRVHVYPWVLVEMVGHDLHIIGAIKH